MFSIDEWQTEARMATLIDLNAEVAKLTLLRGRTPQTTAAEREGTAARLAPYRDGGIFVGKFSGEGHWERHRSGDELVHIIDGAATLHLMTEEGPVALSLTGGMIAIVPQAVWHRFESPDGVTVMTATPLPTDHPLVHVDDPRTLD
jgi:mannose-6-phosphate isomerase-like protein (cupin superfamily)